MYKKSEKMSKIIKNLLLIIIFFEWENAYAQKPKLTFEHLASKEGLSNTWVKCIYRDSRGYMWFGMGDNGINKYDGYNFTVYKNNPEDSNSLSNNKIQVIKEDKKQNLWVGTEYGINEYNRDLDRFEVYFPFYKSHTRFVNGFSVGNDGEFYVITLHDLILLDTKRDTLSFIIKEGGESQYTFVEKGILEYDNNKFLLGTDNGLFSFEAIHNNIKPVIKDIDVSSMYKDKKGKIWIGTVKNGLFYITYNNDSINPVYKNYVSDPGNKYSISYGEITTLQEDNSGFLWIGTRNDGINILNLDSLNAKEPIFYHYRSIPGDNSSLSSNSITAIYKDFEGTMWVSAFNGGVNYYNKVLHKFEHIKSNPSIRNGLNDNNVNAIYGEGKYLWIGTEKGLNLYNKEKDKWQHFSHDKSHDKSISSNAVWEIYKDSHKNMWIGTWGGGLNLFNEKEKTFKYYLHDDNDNSSISRNNVFDIKEDKDGILWVPTMGGGLNRFNYKTETFKTYKNDTEDGTSILNNWVMEILESDSGEIWVATADGLDRFDKEKEVFYHFTHSDEDPKSLSSNEALTVFEDSKKNLWIGNENGLNLFNRDSSNFSLYSEKNGLPNNVIKGICEDDHGNLWISTNKGLSKFINAVNRPKEPEFKNYTTDEGLQSNVFTSRSCFKDKDGKLYFGGNNGFNVFHPDSIKNNPYKPQIVFSDLLIFNNPVKIGKEESPLKKHISRTKEIVLSYKQSVIAIKYAGLNYLAPKKCEYAYMLEGFDKGWNYIGNKREATYTNLDPRTYTFRVKGSNNDGVWNEEEASLKIIITPPFWQTLWFRFSMIVLIILAVYAIHLIRVKNIIAYGRELEIKVAERTQDLENANKQIAAKANELNKSNKELEDFAYIVSHDLKAPLRGINELSNWIFEDYSNVLDKEGKENLTMLIERSMQMNGMIQGILEYSRVGRTEGKVEKIDLNKLLKEVIDLLAPPDNIKIKVENKLPKYKADRIRLTQLFQNLLSNAIKYIDKPKGIIKIGCAEEKNEWEFSVSDNGPGIEEKYFEKIFKIFQTLGSTPSDESTGIGLTITKKIIDLYKGRIWVESEINKGTTFYFTLPKQ